MGSVACRLPCATWITNAKALVDDWSAAWNHSPIAGELPLAGCFISKWIAESED